MAMPSRGVPSVTPDTTRDPSKLYRYLTELERQLASSMSHQMPMPTQSEPADIDLEMIRAALSFNGSYPLSVERLTGVLADAQVAGLLVASVEPPPQDYPVNTLMILTGSPTRFKYNKAGTPNVWTTITAEASAPANMVTTDTTQTITGAKTITAPTIADLTNMQHDHQDADDGGQLVVAAHSDYSSGNVGFSAGNFTASSGSWTVDAGDQTAYSYSRFGNILAIHFTIESTDVSATPDSLRITLPNSYAASSLCSGAYWYQNAGGAWAVGFWIIAASGTYVELRRDPIFTAWSTTAADNTSVSGTAVIRI